MEQVDKINKELAIFFLLQCDLVAQQNNVWVENL
jgi:hypothetical protein